MSHLGPRFPVGAEGERAVSPVGLRHLAAPPCPPPALSQLLTSEGEGELFKMSIISLIILKYCLGWYADKERPCAIGARSPSRSRRTCKMGRLCMFRLAGRILSCPGPLWPSEASDTVSLLLYTEAACLHLDERGGRRKNLYLTWNLHSKPQTYSSLSSAGDQ